MASRFPSHRPQAQTRFSLHQPQHTYSSDEDDDDEEEEAALSRLHGEAQEATATITEGKKRQAQDNANNTLEEEYASKRRRRAPRPTLTAEMLTGGDGLIRLPVEFPAKLRTALQALRKHHHNNNKKNTKQKNPKTAISAAATYSRTLVQAYHSFAHDLLPTTVAHPDDVLLTIIPERLGTTKPVKAHVQEMRLSARNAYVERLFGKSKAEGMLQELDEGLLRHEQQHDLPEPLEEHDAVSLPIRTTAKPTNSSNGSAMVSPPQHTTTMTTTTNQPVDNSASDHEMQATFPPQEPEMTTKTITPLAVTTTNKRDNENDNDDDDSSLVAEMENAVPTQHMSGRPQAGPFNDDDDDHDEEQQQPQKEATLNTGETTTTTSREQATELPATGHDDHKDPPSNENLWPAGVAPPDQVQDHATTNALETQPPAESVTTTITTFEQQSPEEPAATRMSFTARADKDDDDNLLLETQPPRTNAHETIVDLQQSLATPASSSSNVDPLPHIDNQDNDDEIAPPAMTTQASEVPTIVPTQQTGQLDEHMSTSQQLAGFTDDENEEEDE